MATMNGTTTDTMTSDVRIQQIEAFAGKWAPTLSPSARWMFHGLLLDRWARGIKSQPVSNAQLMA